MFKTTLKLTALSALALGAVACAGSQATPRFDEATIAADSRFADYSSVYIADVAVSPELANRQPRVMSRMNETDRAISERDLKRKAADLKKELKTALSGSKKIVSRPGEGVLTVSAEIVDLASSKPTMADFRAEPALSHDSRYSGKAHIRVTISNGDSVLATVRENYTGDLNDYSYSVSTWGDADRGFSIAADKVARLIS